MYQAAATGHLAVSGHPEWDAPGEHELRPDGKSLCGEPRSNHDAYRGHPARMTQDGRGTVTCGSCERIH